MAHQDRVDHRVLLISKLILVQPAQAFVGRNGDIAGGRYQAAIQNFHKRRFAAAIGADQAVAIAIAEFDRDIFEQGLGSKLHGDIGGRDQRSIPDTGVSLRCNNNGVSKQGGYFRDLAAPGRACSVVIIQALKFTHLELAALDLAIEQAPQGLVRIVARDSDIRGVIRHRDLAHRLAVDAGLTGEGTEDIPGAHLLLAPRRRCTG